MEKENVVVAYTIKRLADGGIDVENLGLEGTEQLSDEQIYRDIEDVARIIDKKRVENAAYAGYVRAYNDIKKYEAQLAAAEAQDNEAVL